jgi:hypothetical protein
MRPKDLYVEEQMALAADPHYHCTGPDRCCPACYAGYVADMAMLAQAEAEAELANLAF